MLPLFLAQADTPPAEIVSWLSVAMYLILSAGGVVGLLVGIKSLREKPAEVPQPLTVQSHVPFVSKPDFDKAIKEAHGRMNREKAERDEEVAAMKDETAALREKIDREVDAMRDLVDKAHEGGEARANRINDRIDTLGKQVAEMPKQIVSLLRDASDLTRSHHG